MRTIKITTIREIPDEYWEDYKKEMSFLPLDFDKLETEGKVVMSNHKQKEIVTTTYELTP